MIGRLVPLAECINRLTGIRSVDDRWRSERRLGPVRQLWQPMSAMAVVARLRVSSGRVCPWHRKSSACAEIQTLRLGWGGDRFLAPSLGVCPRFDGGVSPRTWCPAVQTQRSRARLIASTSTRCDLVGRRRSRWCRMQGSVYACVLFAPVPCVLGGHNCIHHDCWV